MSSLNLKNQPTDVDSTDEDKEEGECSAKHLAAANITYLCVIWYQVSAMKWMTSALFWDITQHIVVIP